MNDLNEKNIDPLNKLNNLYLYNWTWTHHLGDLVKKEEEHYFYPKKYFEAKNTPLNLMLLDEAEDCKNLKTIPLNLLLLCTGYFSIKSVSANKAYIDWTSQQHRKTFFRHYSDLMGYYQDFLYEFFDNNQNNELESLSSLLLNIKNYFRKMPKKNYDLGEDENENNNVHIFFFLIMDSFINGNYDKSYLRNTLVDKTIWPEGTPDIVIARDKENIILVLQLLKTGNQKTFSYFYLIIVLFLFF